MNLEAITKYFASQGGLWAYLTVFAATFIEGIFPPIPSDVVVIFCAVLAAKGSLHWMPLFLSAFLGGTLGALLVYWIGASRGRSFFLARPRPFLSPSRLLEMERHFQRFGNVILALNRAVIGGRSFGFLIAGLAGYRFKRVLAYGTPGIAAWYFLIIFLGSAFGERAEDLIKGIIATVMILLAMSALSLILTKRLFR
jgi:membrane protein DedA with SNARE-associated domain